LRALDRLQLLRDPAPNVDLVSREPRLAVLIPLEELEALSKAVDRQAPAVRDRGQDEEKADSHRKRQEEALGTTHPTGPALVDLDVQWDAYGLSEHGPVTLHRRDDDRGVIGTRRRAAVWGGFQPEHSAAGDILQNGLRAKVLGSIAHDREAKALPVRP